jgi:DNA-binding transcriptional MerR regulator
MGSAKPEIPDKRYFKIGEVSDLTGLKAYVLRFWETEFKEIRPTRTLSGQRVFTQDDLKTIITIKELLYDRKYTIPGARAFLKKQRAAAGEGETQPCPEETPEGLSTDEIRSELAEILAVFE